MEQHESESDIERLHEYLSARNIVKSRYWIISYCTFSAFVGLLFGLFLGAAYIQKDKIENKALYKAVGTVHAYGQDYYELSNKITKKENTK
jgi:hypothetical protein